MPLSASACARARQRKILVVGNHDNAFLRDLRRAFDEVAACAHLPGEPHLLFTHVPLDDVPDGCRSTRSADRLGDHQATARR